MMDIKHIMECPSCDVEHITYGEDFNIDELLEHFYNCESCRSEICDECLKNCDECGITLCEKCLDEHEKDEHEEDNEGIEE